MNRKLRGYITYDSYLGAVVCVPSEKDNLESQKYHLNATPNIKVNPFTNNWVEGYVNEKGLFVAEKQYI